MFSTQQLIINSTETYTVSNGLAKVELKRDWHTKWGTCVSVLSWCVFDAGVNVAGGYENLNDALQFAYPYLRLKD
jgi:hypothetical protein